MKRLGFIILFLAVAGGLVWLVWFKPAKQEEEEKKPEADVPVQVGKVTRVTLRAYITAYGTVEPEPPGQRLAASARVAPSVPGVVTAVKCAEGQQVEKGTVLFQLDSRAADVAVEKARKAAEFAEKTLDRQKKLMQVEGTSQKLVLDAEQALAAARSELAAAQTQQALLQVQAPLAGTVARVNTKPGEAVDLTTALAEIIDLNRLVVTANVPSAEVAELKVGQPAEVQGEGSAVTHASVAFLSPQVDAKTGSGLLRVALPAHSGLRPGQFVKVRITSAEHKDCLAVPLASVARDATGANFVALVEGDKAMLKPVKIGVRDGDLVEVEGEGVEADKTVVTEGAYGIVMTQQFATKIRVVNE